MCFYVLLRCSPQWSLRCAKTVQHFAFYSNPNSFAEISRITYFFTYERASYIVKNIYITGALKNIGVWFNVPSNILYLISKGLTSIQIYDVKVRGTIGYYKHSSHWGIRNYHKSAYQMTCISDLNLFYVDPTQSTMKR